MKTCPICDGSGKCRAEIRGTVRQVHCPECDGLGKVNEAKTTTEFLSFIVTFYQVGKQWFYETGDHVSTKWRSPAFDNFPDAANRFTIDHIRPDGQIMITPPLPAAKPTVHARNGLSIESMSSYVKQGWYAFRPNWDKDHWLKADMNPEEHGQMLLGGKFHWQPSIHDIMATDWIVQDKLET